MLRETGLRMTLTGIVDQVQDGKQARRNRQNLCNENPACADIAANPSIVYLCEYSVSTCSSAANSNGWSAIVTV